ncbi:MAG: PepSY domain-containing protein [Fimbriimonadales bacterium]
MIRILRTLVVAISLIATVAFAGQKNQKPPHVKTTAAQAQKTALAKYHGTVVGKVELENEDGKWQYAVVIKSGKIMREVMVDANTGKIGSVEKVTAAEEAKEKAAEAKEKNKGKGKGG